MKALGEVVTDLAWLPPAHASLVALARPARPSAWAELRSDPGAVLLLARVADKVDASLSLADLAAHPRVLETAIDLLPCAVPSVAWSLPGPCRVRQLCLRQAKLAEALAERVGADPRKAWCAGLLTPLGWLGLCAVDAERVARDLVISSHSAGWQFEAWGMDHTAIARRLSRWWRLPAWLASIVGNLGLHVDIAQRLGADPLLFQLTQFAVALTQQHDASLALTVGASSVELCQALGVPLDEALSWAHELRDDPVPLVADSGTPLLADLLRLALETRRQMDVGWVQRLENDLDQLQHALVEQCRGEEDRLTTRKLSALGELAAGAGHEINNPLAVISGQAQYALRQLHQLESLLVEEPELAGLLEPLQSKMGHALQTIVGQTHRIHQLLTDLMQFARPSTPKPQAVSVHALVQDVGRTLEELAQSRKVRLLYPPVGLEEFVQADPQQARTILSCVWRNAIEAAPAEGWTGVRVEHADDGPMRLVVEDNGPGPAPGQREHLFDPFYSGRSAGRGRGLGLPVAWRLARQQGGDVRFEGHQGGVTRFAILLAAVCPDETLPGPHLRNGHLTRAAV